MRPWLDKKGYEVEEFMDDGISGENIEQRPAFIELLEALEQSKFDVLSVYMTDRIGRFRDRSERHRVMEVIEKSEVLVDSFYDGQFDPKSEDDLDQLEKALTEARAFNRRMTKRVIDGQKRALRQGTPATGRIPFGLKWNKDKQKFEVNRSQYDTLKEMLRLFRSGFSLQKVCDRLNADFDQHPTWSGSQWDSSSVHRIWNRDHLFSAVLIRNQFSQKFDKKAGKRVVRLKPEEEWIEVPLNIQPLFTKEDVEEVRQRMSVRKKRGKKKIPRDSGCFMLQRLVKCGQCGIKLSIQETFDRKADWVYRYYKCSNAHKGKCTLKVIDADNLDIGVWQKFISVMAEPDKLKRAVLDQEYVKGSKRKDLQKLVKKYEADIDSIQRKLNRAREVYMNEPDYSKEDYEAKRAKFLEKLKQAELERDRAKTALEQPDRVMAAIDAASQAMAETVEKLAASKQWVEYAKELDESGEPDKAMLARYKLAVRVHQHLKEKGIKKTPEIRKLLDKQEREILVKFVAAGGEIKAWTDNVFSITGVLPVQDQGGGGGGSSPTGFFSLSRPRPSQ
jgi:site-specific DNA recombinase